MRALMRAFFLVWLNLAGVFCYKDFIYNNDTLTLRLSSQSRQLTGAPGSRHNLEFILQNHGPPNRFVIRQDGDLSGTVNRPYIDLKSDEMIMITVEGIVLYSGEQQYQKYILHVSEDKPGQSGGGSWNNGGGGEPWNNGGGSGYNPGDQEWSEWGSNSDGGSRPNINGRQRPEVNGGSNDGFNSGSGGFNDGSNGRPDQGGYNNGGYNDGSNGGYNNGGYNDGSNGGSGGRPDNGGYNNGGFNDGSNGGYNNGGYNDGSNGGYNGGSGGRPDNGGFNNGGYNDGSNGGYNDGSGGRPDGNGGYNNGGYNDGSSQGGYHGGGRSHNRDFGDRVDYLRKGVRSEIKSTVLFQVKTHEEPVDMRLPEIITEDLDSECDDDLSCNMNTWSATWRVRDEGSGLFMLKMKDTGDREPFWWHENFEVGTKDWVTVQAKVSCCAEGVGLEVEDIKTNNLIGYEEREDADAWDINLIIGISVGVGVLILIIVVVVVVFVVRKKYVAVPTNSG